MIVSLSSFLAQASKLTASTMLAGRRWCGRLCLVLFHAFLHLGLACFHLLLDFGAALLHRLL